MNTKTLFAVQVLSLMMPVVAFAWPSAVLTTPTPEGDEQNRRDQLLFEGFETQCAGQAMELFLDVAESSATAAAVPGEPKNCHQLFVEARAAAPRRLEHLYKTLPADEFRAQLQAMLPLLEKGDIERLKASMEAVDRQTRASAALKANIGAGGQLADSLNGVPVLDIKTDAATGSGAVTFAGRSVAFGNEERAVLGKDDRLYVGNPKGGGLRWFSSNGDSGFELPDGLGEARVRRVGGGYSRSVVLSPRVLAGAAEGKDVDLSAIPSDLVSDDRKKAFQIVLKALPGMPQLGPLFAKGKPAVVVIRDGQLRVSAADKTQVLADVTKVDGQDRIEALVVRGKNTMLWRLDPDGKEAALLTPKSDGEPGTVEYEAARAYRRDGQKWTRTDGGQAEEGDELGGVEAILVRKGMKAKEWVGGALASGWDKLKFGTGVAAETVGDALSPLTSAGQLAVGTTQRMLGAVTPNKWFTWNKFGWRYTVQQSMAARKAGYGLDTAKGQAEAYDAALKGLDSDEERAEIVAYLNNMVREGKRKSDPVGYRHDPAAIDLVEPSREERIQAAAGTAGNSFGVHMSNASETWDEGGLGTAKAAFHAALGGMQAFAETYAIGLPIGAGTKFVMARVVAARTGLAAAEVTALANNTAAIAVTGKQGSALRLWDVYEKGEKLAGAGLFVAPAVVGAGQSAYDMVQANDPEGRREHAAELYHTAAGFAGLLKGVMPGGAKGPAGGASGAPAAPAAGPGIGELLVTPSRLPTLTRLRQRLGNLFGGERDTKKENALVDARGAGATAGRALPEAPAEPVRTVPLSEVRPTQMDVGKAQCEEMLGRLRQEAVDFRKGKPEYEHLSEEAALAKYLQEQVIGADVPVGAFIGPDGKTYVTDGHHRTVAISLALAGELKALPSHHQPGLKVKVLGDYTGRPQAEFAKALREAGAGNFTPELEARTRARVEELRNQGSADPEGQALAELYANLPADFAGIGDNPMRAAVGEAFKANGLKSPQYVDYIEFRVAQWLEARGVTVDSIAAQIRAEGGKVGPRPEVDPGVVRRVRQELLKAESYKEMLGAPSMVKAGKEPFAKRFFELSGELFKQEDYFRQKGIPEEALARFRNSGDPATLEPEIQKLKGRAPPSEAAELARAFEKWTRTAGEADALGKAAKDIPKLAGRLQGEYKNAFDDARGQMLELLPEAEFGDQSARPKGASSIEAKVSKAHLKGIDSGRQGVTDAAQARAAVDDAIGTRVTLKDASPRSVDALVDRLVEAIDRGELEVTKINNYRSKADGLPYGGESHIGRIRDAMARQGKEVEVAAGDRVLKESGYTSLQMGVRYRNGATGELQVRGRRVNTLAEIEHINYDLKTGKGLNPGLQKVPELAAVAKTIQEFTPEQQGDFNDYIAASYRRARLLEQGGAGAAGPEVRLPASLEAHPELAVDAIAAHLPEHALPKPVAPVVPAASVPSRLGGLFRGWSSWGKPAPATVNAAKASENSWVEKRLGLVDALTAPGADAQGRALPESFDWRHKARTGIPERLSKTPEQRHQRAIKRLRSHIPKWETGKSVPDAMPEGLVVSEKPLRTGTAHTNVFETTHREGGREVRAALKVDAGTSEPAVTWEAGQVPLPEGVHTTKVLAAERWNETTLRRHGLEGKVSPEEATRYIAEGRHLMLMEKLPEDSHPMRDYIFGRLRGISPSEVRGKLLEAAKTENEFGRRHGDFDNSSNVRLVRDPVTGEVQVYILDYGQGRSGRAPVTDGQDVRMLEGQFRLWDEQNAKVR